MFKGTDGKPLFGMDAMFNPSSGRLAYARGRLGPQLTINSLFLSVGFSHCLLM